MCRSPKEKSGNLRRDISIMRPIIIFLSLESHCCLHCTSYIVKDIQKIQVIRYTQNINNEVDSHCSFSSKSYPLKSKRLKKCYVKGYQSGEYQPVNIVIGRMLLCQFSLVIHYWLLSASKYCNISYINSPVCIPVSLTEHTGDPIWWFADESCLI